MDGADLIITALPEQKKGLVDLCPKLENRIFTIREMLKQDGYLLHEDFEFKDIPGDDIFWDYVEENPDYASNFLSEMEWMLSGAYPHILERLELKIGGE